MTYPSLYDRERNARDATAGEIAEEQARRNAEELGTRRTAALQGVYKLFDTILALGEKALSLVYRRDETGKLIERYVETNPSLDDGDLVQTILKLLISFPYVILVAGVDFLFLSAAASFFLSLAGITHPVAVLIGKMVLPFFVVFLEIAPAVHAYRRGSKPSTSSFILPCVIALLAGMTYLAYEGVMSLADVTFFTVGMLIVVLALGFFIHFFVVVLAPRVIEGFAFLFLVVLRRKYQRLVEVAEQAAGTTYAGVLNYVRGVREYNDRFDQVEVPRLDQLPENIRDLINRYAGNEVIPSPDASAFRGDGAASTLPSFDVSPDGDEAGRDGHTR